MAFILFKIEKSLPLNYSAVSTKLLSRCKKIARKEENKMKVFYLKIGFVLFVVAPVFAQDIPQTADAFLKLGNQQLGQKNYDAAINSYSECLKLAPNNVNCYFSRAVTYNAKASLEPLTPQQVVSADGVNIINETRLKALADANKVIELAPREAEGYYIRAALYTQEKIFDRAIADYRQSLIVEPNLAATSAHIYGQIIQGLTEAEKGLPFSIVVKGRRLDLRAWNLSRAGDKAGARILREQAIEHFSAAIALDKTTTDAFNDRARMYRNLENYDAAIADYTEVLKISEPKKLAVKNYLGIYLYALNDRAGIYALQNKTALALTDYEAVLAMPLSKETEFPIQTARVERGKLYLGAGRLNDAIADFDKILAQTPKYGQVLYFRGLAHSRKGDKVKAIADLKAAIELDPKNEEAVAELKKLDLIG